MNGTKLPLFAKGRLTTDDEAVVQAERKLRRARRRASLTELPGVKMALRYIGWGVRGKAAFCDQWEFVPFIEADD